MLDEGRTAGRVVSLRRPALSFLGVYRPAGTTHLHAWWEPVESSSENFTLNSRLLFYNS